MKTVKDYFSGSLHFKHIIIVLIVLVVSDGLISQFLTRYGLGTEGNPFLQALLGREDFLLIKLAGALLAAFVLWDMSKSRPGVALVTTLSFVVLYMGILYWNIGVFLISQY